MVARLMRWWPKGVSRLAAGSPGASSSPRRWVGLDLGERSIKLVELEHAASGWRLVNHLIQDLPAGQEGQPVDVAGWLQSAVKTFGARDVHVSLSGPDVAVLRVAAPLMPREELLEAVRWQIKDQVGFPVQDALIECEALGDVWEKDIKKQDLLVVAAPRAGVEERLAAVQRAGCRVVSVCPARAALWRGIEALAPEYRQGALAVVEIGAQATHLLLVKDGQIRIVRELALGSESLTQALVGVVTSEQGEVTIDAARAEALKRRYGVLTESADGTTEDGVPLFHVASLMRPVLEQLLTELSRSCDFYRVQMDEAGISRMLLVGGGAGLRGLPAFLAEGLGMTVEVFNPLMRLTERARMLEPEQVAEDGPRLATAIGLAADHGQRTNLLPPEVRAARASGAAQRALARVGLRLGALLAAGYVLLQAYALWLGWQAQSQRRAWEQLRPSYARYVELAANAKTLRGMVGQLQAFQDQQPVWEGLLKELSALVPTAIELDAVEVDTADPLAEPFEIRLSGRAVSAGGKPGEGSLSALVQALEQSVFFQRVELTDSQMQAADKDVTTFKMEAVLE